MRERSREGKLGVTLPTQGGMPNFAAGGGSVVPWFPIKFGWRVFFFLSLNLLEGSFAGFFCTFSTVFAGFLF